MEVMCRWYVLCCIIKRFFFNKELGNGLRSRLSFLLSHWSRAYAQPCTDVQLPSLPSPLTGVLPAWPLGLEVHLVLLEMGRETSGMLWS